MKKIIVVGAVAGGATCASQIRRLDPESQITVYEKDRDMSFANCGLPYYLGGIVDERSKLLPFKPSQFKEKKGIDVHTYHEVIAINDTEQTVTVKNHQTGDVFDDPYDTLILSPGCRANRLPFESDMAFTLRNMEDTDDIETFIREQNVQKALVIGAGYVALEVLENLHHRGIDTTLIHRSEQINKLMDEDMNQVIIDALEHHNVPYRFNEEVESVDGKTVHFKSGISETYDIIIEGVGVKPNSEFVQSSNITLNKRGYIPVNDKFETNVPNVYAIGDIIESHYRHVERATQVPLAWGAHRAASIVAEQIAGDHTQTFNGFLGANIVKVFDYSLASVGIKPQELADFDYDVVETKQGAHAGYYPGNTKIHLRVYFEKGSRKILRAAAVGENGVDKRIDVLSMAMMHNMTVDALTEFEVAYAPPYSSPKDAINMIGYKARNK